MEWQLHGKLQSAAKDAPSFAGCRIDAFFDRVFVSPQPATHVSTPGKASKRQSAQSTAVRRGSASIREAGVSDQPDATRTPTSTQGSIPARVATVSDAAGNFTLVLPDRQEIASERIKFEVSSATGRTIAEKELVTARIGDPITIDVHKIESTVLISSEKTQEEMTRRVKGRVIERNGKQLPATFQVLLLAGKRGGAKGDPLVPILAAKADSSGYFSGEVPNSKYDTVVALVAGIPGETPVQLDNSVVPSQLPIVVDMPSTLGSAPSDCNCSTAVPRTPSQQDISDSPGMFSADLGTGQCIHFNVPNRAIEEFNFYSVVRTTEPDISGITTGVIRDKPVQLPAAALPGVIVSAPLASSSSSEATLEAAIREAIEALRMATLAHGMAASWTSLEATIRTAVVNAGGAPLSPGFFGQFSGWGVGQVWGFGDPGSAGVIFGTQSAGQLSQVVKAAAEASAGASGASAVNRALSVSSHPDLGAQAHIAANPKILSSVQNRQIDIYKLRGLPRPLGRVPLDARAPVDWDSTPTFYEATTIAHGHLLHFKQVWYADGYSLGDLVYSLPLAPGQKKLISVVDWERRDQTSREEYTSADESLQSALSRDRDVSEVVTGALSESSRGGSRNTTTGVGVGTGAAGNGSYQQFNFGALLGVSGGVGDSSSSAFQDSSRNLSSSSLQSLRDRTLQSASAVRNLRSTIVQTSRQGETVRATTEVVANHNHCHALTIQYFEVLRHLKITHELTDVQECLFVPLPMSEFDRPKVLRWRQQLSTYLQRTELAPAFDATRRVETLWAETNTPAARYADELVSAIFGELMLTILIPLPPFPEKPKPNPGDTAADTAAAVAQALSPTSGFLGAVLAIASGGASLVASGAIGATTDAVKATTKGAQAMAESLLNEPSAEERYARFQQEVMPAAAAGFIDQLELYALVGANEIMLGGADFTLVSNYQPGTPLLVSVRGRVTNPIRRADISAIVIKSSAPLPPGCRAIVNSASLHYQTNLFRHDLVNDPRVNDDIDLPIVAYTGATTVPIPPVPIPGFPTNWIPVAGMTPIRGGDGAILYTPLDEWEQRSPRLEDIRLSAELEEHLNANLEYYHNAIWWTMDPNRRYMLLDGYEAPNADGRSVASVVDNTLIGIVGNSLILPVAPGNRLDPRFKLADGMTLLDAYAPQSPVPPSRVSLPTRGVFAEAVMGDCNSCEEIDDTRFWRWDEVPIDEPPPLDTSALASRQTPPSYGTPTQFPTPIVSIQNAPAAPDPAGVKAALDTLSKQSFPDITGLAGTQANAAAAYSKAMDTALQFGKEASTLAQQAAMTKNIGQTMRAIDKAEGENKIDQGDAKQLRTSALRTMTGDTPSERAKAQESKAATDVMDKIPGDSVKSVQTGTTKVTARPNPSGLTTTSGQPKSGSVNVQLLANYSDGQPMAAQVTLVFLGNGQRVVFEQTTSDGPIEGVAQDFVALSPGSWAIGGQILILHLPANFVRSIPATIGGDTMNLDISNFISGAAWQPLNGRVNVQPGARTLDLQLTAELEDYKIGESIELESSYDVGGDLELEAKLKPAIAKLVEPGEVGGKISVSGKWSGTTKRKLDFEVHYSRIKSLTVVQPKD
jgi:hypothetical protein